jgi:hypothetical protein
MRTQLQEESIKQLAQRLWELAGKPANSAESFYYEAERHLSPHFSNLRSLTCDCCGRKFVGEDPQDQWRDVFCSQSCERHGPT